MDPVLPALEGACVARIVPALFGQVDDEWIPPTARSADAVVLLVLDGLGWSAVQDHAPSMPRLTAMDGGPITTVAPSTTATALTSIATGLAPAQHGIVGYRMLVGDEVLNVLRWSSSNRGRLPEPNDVQRYAPFLGREVPVVTRTEFRDTGFTRAHLRGTRLAGWHTTVGLIEQCVRAVEAGEKFVYAYYPGIDAIAHEFGLLDGVFANELAFADRLVGELVDALPASATVLVTSDHGQIHLDAASWIDIPELGALATTMAGDGRFRYLYAPAGGGRDLLAAARELVSDRAWVWSRAELLEMGVLGNDATGNVPGRIGNVVLAAREPVAFVDPALPNERNLKSGHGSLTPDEMYVPLLAAAGTRAR
ncbi:MAG TPA: alkaline phosphatase family protein [Acidimicrobiia bacterium]|nr:alkaline phosphatase family protein [Acidimicrobiia bacterium]